MKPQKKADVLVILMVLAGVALLAFRYGPELKTPSPLEQIAAEAIPVVESTAIPLAQEENLSVDVSALVSPRSFTFDDVPPLADADLVVIFVLNASVCPPCLNELSEYAYLLEELNLSGLDARSVALVFAEDRQGEHFVRSAALPVPAGYGQSPEAAEVLGQYDQVTGELLQQMAFIDVSRGTLFFRALLSTTTTDLDVKRAALKEMLDGMPSAHSLQPTLQ